MGEWIRTLATIVAMIVGGTWAIGQLPTGHDFDALQISVDRMRGELVQLHKELRLEMAENFRQRDESFQRRVLSIVNDPTLSRRFTRDDGDKMQIEQDRVHSIYDKRLDRIENEVRDWDMRLDARLDALRRLYGWTADDKPQKGAAK